MNRPKLIVAIAAMAFALGLAHAAQAAPTPNATASSPLVPAMSAAQTTEETRYRHLAQELRCLVCQNQNLADSEADLALDLKREVRQQIRSGQSDQQIMDYMVARYGDFVLYRPPVKALTWFLWGAPLALAVLGLGLLARHIHRRAGESGTQTFDKLSPNGELTRPLDTASSTSSANRSIPHWVLATGLLACLALAAGLYAFLGRAPALRDEAAKAATAAPAAVDAAQIEAMVARLAERLQKEPKDVAGWQRLARSYMVLERYSEAAGAYAQVERRARAQIHQDPQALLDYAKALALSQEGYRGKAAQLVGEALQLAPNEPQVLLIAGLSAAQNGQRRQALALWQKLLPMIPAGHPLEALIQNGLRQLQSEGSENKVSRPASPAKPPAGPASSPSPKNLSTPGA